MNRFRDALNDLRRRAEKDPQIKDLILGEDITSGGTGSKQETEQKSKLRLPYSSYPESVEEPWADT